MPDLTQIRQIGLVLDLEDERFEIGDTKAAVEKQDRMITELQAFFAALNLSIQDMNTLAAELSVEDVLQARWKGWLTFETRAGLVASGAPAGAGTPESPIALVYGDDENNGHYAYENGVWVKQTDWTRGPRGLSAYKVAVDGGYTGTQEQWLESLKGASAYEVAVAGGYAGNQAAWLESLKGASAYEVAVEQGYSGSASAWLASLRGLSAYEVALDNGFVGSPAAWLASLQGDPGGPPGPSAYDVAVSEGFVGDEAAWVASLQGPRGLDGSGGGGAASAMGMLERFGVSRWWLAAVDAEEGFWQNRGTLDISIALDSNVGVGDYGPDFSALRFGADGTPFYIEEQPLDCSASGQWSVAIGFSYEGNNGSALSERLFHAMSNRGVRAYRASDGDLVTTVQSASATGTTRTPLPQSKDYVYILTYDGTTSTITVDLSTPDEPDLFSDTINTSGLGDFTPDVTDTWFLGAASGNWFNSWVGDIVIDNERAWNAVERAAAARALPYRYHGIGAVVRRTFEASHRGIPLPGPGLVDSGVGLFEVLPDTVSGDAIVPLSVRDDGCGVDASLIIGRGYGPPIDRTGITFKPNFGARGSLSLVDQDIELRPVVASDVAAGCYVAMLNVGVADVTAYGALGVSFHPSSKTKVKVGELVVAIAMGTNQWYLTGAAS